MRATALQDKPPSCPRAARCLCRRYRDNLFCPWPWRGPRRRRRQLVRRSRRTPARPAASLLSRSDRSSLFSPLLNARSNHLGKPLRPLLAQIAVEYHAYIADQQTPRRQHADISFVDGDEPVGRHRPELAEFRREAARKFDRVAPRDRVHIQLEVTDQLGDDLAAQEIVRAQGDTAVDRQRARVEPLIILI